MGRTYFNKRVVRLLSFIILIMIIFSLTAVVVSAQIYYCCEKTTNGAWCQKGLKEECDAGFKASPTSCDSTSYCKTGCCFDSAEGLCMENTPQRVCDDSGGSWADDANCNVPQCNLGCCIIGDQAALVTQTRCKALTGFYGLEVDFRKSITDELTCIETANAQDIGACVFEDPETFSPTCKFTTRGECNYDFHEGILCSADELGTVCGPSTKTTLSDSGDEVYYTDTCGNPANIYDSTKYNDELYWKKIFTKAESCGAGQSNAGSKTCGNCNYFLGSIGKKAKAGNKPTYGDYICTDLSCGDREHGESWCVSTGSGSSSSSSGDSDSSDGRDVSDITKTEGAAITGLVSWDFPFRDEGTTSGVSKSASLLRESRVGTRHFKQICVNNEILVEPCYDYRNEVCVEQETNGFSEAACTVNRWQTCISQTTKKKCENTDQRDCQWMEGYYFGTSGDDVLVSYSVRNPKTGKKITNQGVCLPQVSPGLPFWGQPGSGISASEENLNRNRFTGNAFKTITGFFITSRAAKTEEISDEEDTTDTDTSDTIEEDTTDTVAPTTDTTTTQQFPDTSQQTNPFGTGAVTPRTTISASDICSAGNAEITVNFKRYKYGYKFSGYEEWICTGESVAAANNDPRGADICQYFTEANLTNPSGFAAEFNAICIRLGDCGKKENYIGVTTDDGYAVYFNNSRVLGSGGGEIYDEDDDSDTTGSVIGAIIKDLYVGEPKQ